MAPAARYNGWTKDLTPEKREKALVACNWGVACFLDALGAHPEWSMAAETYRLRYLGKEPEPETSAEDEAAAESACKAVSMITEKLLSRPTGVGYPRPRDNLAVTENPIEFGITLAELDARLHLTASPVHDSQAIHPWTGRFSYDLQELNAAVEAARFRCTVVPDPV